MSNTITAIPAFVTSEKGKRLGRGLLLIVLAAGLLLLATQVFSSDGAEFSDAVNKFELWVKGNLGKTAAFVALAAGALMAAVKKDWSWFFGAVVISMGVGIVVSIINASFTAIV